MADALAADISPTDARAFRRGILLVAGAALAWSFGGAIARSIAATDSWTLVFWRATFAALTILAFMLAREGARGMAASFRAMGLAGVAVALCFGTAMTSFVVALAYTSVANILLMQAAVPLIAALLGRLFFGETIPVATGVAIAAVIAGMAVMVSDSFAGGISPIGDGLAMLISTVFAVATVLTRRNADVRMMPAVCLGAGIAAVFSATLAGSFLVSPADFAWLFAFGALTLGLGLAMFVTGARLVPAPLAGLVGMLEPVLGPVWVWLAHGEATSARTMLGGAIIFAALAAHLWAERRRQSDQG